MSKQIILKKIQGLAVEIKDTEIKITELKNSESAIFKISKTAWEAVLDKRLDYILVLGRKKKEMVKLLREYGNASNNRSKRRNDLLSGMYTQERQVVGIHVDMRC